MFFRLVLVALLVTSLLAEARPQVNRVSIQGGLDSVFGCCLSIRNTEQMLDLRTDCKLGNHTEAPGLNRLLQLIPDKKAYYFR